MKTKMNDTESYNVQRYPELLNGCDFINKMLIRMRLFLLTLFLCFSALTAMAQDKQMKTQTSFKSTDTLLVDAACGQCKLGLPGESCDLAIRVNGKAYFVDGTNIDSHGDAHAKDGFCNALRKAKVQGSIMNNRFVATYFQLVSELPKNKSD